ncbi:MAG TPA: L-rhamnose mutarotase [Puia sp.]|nr:L-rhamnose mutarotase [Puia sp.]
MMRIAFTMTLKDGFTDEYKNRHDAIWPELKGLLKKTGIRDYSIFLDERTNILFACLSVYDAARLDELPGDPVMKRWWSYMQDIMETNPDGSPRSIALKEVFYLE